MNISLHIGVNRLSLEAYESDGALGSPINDARAMAAIAKAEGFEPCELLLGEQATTTAFLERFDHYARLLQAGDTFFITFSGHGGQVADDNGDEADGLDETWCFYNDHLIDDELGKRWKNFKQGVRIIVVSASCHSRTALKVLTTDCFSGNGQQHTCSKEVKENETSILSSYINDPEIKADIIHLSACEDAQEAQDGAQLSLFTKLLVKHWDEGRFQGSFEDLIIKIKSEAGYSQRPGIAVSNNRQDLLSATPFKTINQ